MIMNLQSFRMKTKPEFMIIPMIDIIFFLLVFFMMNSLQTVAQKHYLYNYHKLLVHLHRLSYQLYLHLMRKGILQLITIQ